MKLHERLGMIYAEKYDSLKDFSDDIGVASSYACNLLKGKYGCGIKPITKIIEKHPDIDIRWLVTGEGEMYNHDDIYMIRAIHKIKELERYICVMSVDEIHQFVSCMNNVDIHFPSAIMDKLKTRYEDQYGKRDAIIEEALKKNLKIIESERIQEYPKNINL